MKKSLALFMEEFLAETTLNQLNPRERLWKGCIIEAHPFNGVIQLRSIRALRLGTGCGSAGLSWLCALADRHAVAIGGHIKPLGRGGLSRTQLRAWYRRYGFVVAWDDRIERAPRRS